MEDRADIIVSEELNAIEGFNYVNIQTAQQLKDFVYAYMVVEPRKPDHYRVFKEWLPFWKKESGILTRLLNG